MWHAVARLPVSAQIAGVDVLLLAAAALVGPLVGVHTLVLLEVVCSAEPLLTYVARKRLLSRVESRMLLQAGTSTETLVANLAFKRLLSRVNTKMFLEVRFIGKPLLADAAPVRLLSRVEP